MRLERRREERQAVLFELECTCFGKSLVRDCAIIPQTAYNAQLVIVAKVAQDGPANFHFEFFDQDLLEGFECFEGDAFLGLCGIIVVTLKNKELFECCDIVLLEVLIEHFLLKVGKLFITHVAIVVGVHDAEYPQQSLLKIRSQHLCAAIMQRGDRVKHRILGAVDDIAEA